MKAPLLLLAFSVFLALLVVISGAGLHSISAPPVAASGPSDPAQAAGAEMVLQSCGGCHGLSTLSRTALDANGWRAEVARMEELGARVPPGQEDALVNYLAQHFGPQK